MTIVLDLFYKYDNSIFNYETAKNVIGATWVPLFHSLCKERGIKVKLAHDYLCERIISKDDLLISEGVTSYTGKLLSMPTKPFLLFSCESPNVDWKFYSFIKKNSRPYEYALLFAGCEKFVAKETSFLPLFWPNDSKNCSLDDVLPIKKPKKKLAMIASNKKQNSMAGSNRFKAEIKGIAMKVITRTVPAVRTRDLYAERMNAIQYFSSKAFFDLHGKNWDNTENLTSSEKKAVARLAPTPVENKMETLQGYDFTLCFENCVYPGYITEKIFDCFFAKTIPIYLGAPDIQDYVPNDLFIDMRSFRDFEQLESHILALSVAERTGFIRRTEAYLESSSFARFTDTYFARNIMEVVAKNFAHAN